MMTTVPDVEINQSPEEPTTTSRPEKRKNLLKWTSGAILTIAAGLTIFLWPARSGAKGENLAQELPVVAAAKIEREDVANELQFDSELRPYQEIDVHAKVSGFVDVINVDIGDHVKEGQIIATLELPEVRDDLERALAAQRRSEQEIRRSQAMFEDAYTNFSRLSAIDKATTNLIAQQDIDTATAKERSSEADWAASREQALGAAAEVKKLRTMLQYARITAPFDGIITKRYADKGALIQAGTSSSTQTMPLVRLSQNGFLRIVFPVMYSAVAAVKVGDPVEVDIPAVHRTIHARITRSSQQLDLSTRTMLTEVDFENPDFSLIPGMYAEARLKVDRRPNALVAPVTSLSRKGGETSVYLIKPDGTVEERTIKVGLETPFKVEILSGLQEGDLVLVGSRSEVKAGQRVTAKLVTSTST
jgi:RND family efflux transporter MFP subunit